MEEHTSITRHNQPEIYVFRVNKRRNLSTARNFIISNSSCGNIMIAQTIDRGSEPTPATIEGIYVARRSGAPMESKDTATLIPGKGIDGDRYAIGNGSYSAKFMWEPGKHLTMMSSSSIHEAFERTGMAPLENLGELRRNIVLKGISSQEVNNMVGHEVRIGAHSRVFVHRRCVPCKYREAACKRNGLMNNLWGECGVNCEVLPPVSNEGGAADQKIKVGDKVEVIPGTYQPGRINVGNKPAGFFTRPADRSLEEVKGLVTPSWIAALASMWDPEGFRRVEAAYNSVGQRFWSPDAYATSLLVMAMRIPLMVMLSAILISITVGLGMAMSGLGGEAEL